MYIPLNPLSSRNLRCWKKDRGFELSIVEEMRRTEKRREGTKEEILLVNEEERTNNGSEFFFFLVFNFFSGEFGAMDWRCVVSGKSIFVFLSF